MYYLRMLMYHVFFILSGDETQNLCYNSPDWNYMILTASFNITLVSVIIELSCASHTYKPRSSSVVFNICNTYCLSSSLLMALNLSLPLTAAGLIVESWDMMKSLFRHFRLGNCSYWQNSTTVPGRVIYCVFISLMVPWRPSSIVHKKYKIKCFTRLKMTTYNYIPTHICVRV